MKRLFILFLLVVCMGAQVLAQSYLYLQNPVTFINDYPRIDGVLDSQLTQLPRRQFDDDILKSNEENRVYPVNYRLGYGTDFLYIYIEVEANSMIFRENGYRNGDGFMLSLTVPQFDNRPTEEFYNLGFYPTGDDQKPAGKIIWQYNANYASEILDETCKCHISVTPGKVGYELLLPWKDVYPYHPWFSGEIGFNLFFVKAIPGNEKNIHGVLLDDRLNLDQNLLKYTRLIFGKPVPAQNMQTYVLMNRNSYEGESVEARFVTSAQKKLKEKIQISIFNSTGKLISTEIVEYETDDVLTFKKFDIKTYVLPSGDYRVDWKSLSGTASGYVELTVLPYVFFDEVYDRLIAVRNNISSGSYYTLHFLLNDLQHRNDRLKSYEHVPDLREELIQLLEMIDNAENQNDIISNKRGLFRRAYRMEYSHELWPYSVHIPQNYNPAKTYPLLVFLHEKDRDDRALADHLSYLALDGYILLAPNGRGARNCYTVKEAQIDIQQTIHDVTNHYSIDSARIILTGYSMGGYGVYRTYYETPKKFVALAIFSGQPDLASHYFPRKGHPNFLYTEILNVFKDTPMFIYHGMKDQIAPFELTAEVVEKLKAAGADVEFVISEHAGHHLPAEEDTRHFRRWFRNRF